MSNFLINPLLQPAINEITSGSQKSAADTGFGKVLDEALAETNRLQQQSTDEVKKLMTGDVQDVHTALIAVQKADLSFQMMMQVKNKLVAAYDEVMKMSV